MPALDEPTPLTLSETDYHQWLRAKGRGIGGSDIGAIMGLCAYRGPDSVFDTKLDLGPPFTGNQHTRRGHALEAHAAEEYVRATGRPLAPSRFMKHPERHHLYGTPDRIILQPNSGQALGILEIKCPTSFGYQRVKQDGISPDYYAQLQWYLGIWRAREGEAAADVHGAFAVLNADSWELYSFDVAFDPDFFARAVTEAERFWHDHILMRQRPRPLSLRETVAAQVAAPVVGSEYTRRTDPEWAQAIQRVLALQQERKLVEAQYNRAVAEVRRLIADTPGRYQGGGGRVTLLPSTRHTLNEERLHHDHPGLDLSAYREATQSTTLRITSLTGEA